MGDSGKVWQGTVLWRGRESAEPDFAAMFFDAHNHWQDAALEECRAGILESCAENGVRAMAVNGTHPGDWDAVAAWAARRGGGAAAASAASGEGAGVVIFPQFGLHPWRVGEVGDADWLGELRRRLVADSTAGVGEIGLDRWKTGLDWPVQLTAFRAQMRLAAELDRPVTVHCLKAFGPLIAELGQMELPRRGLLIHAFGGDWSVASQLLNLHSRVFFSFNGYFLQERKAAVREAFARLPPERILLESDAPDMLPPAEIIAAGWRNAAGLVNSPDLLPQVWEAGRKWLPKKEQLWKNSLDFFWCESQGEKPGEFLGSRNAGGSGK